MDCTGIKNYVPTHQAAGPLTRFGCLNYKTRLASRTHPECHDRSKHNALPNYGPLLFILVLKESMKPVKYYRYNQTSLASQQLCGILGHFLLFFVWTGFVACWMLASKLLMGAGIFIHYFCLSCSKCFLVFPGIDMASPET